MNQTEEFKAQIKKLRAQNLWNKIIDLIIAENLQHIWFKVYKGEALFYLSRKEEGKKILENVIKVANKEDPKDMFLLGKSYDILNDVPNAVFWYEKAAELDELNAQNNLAFCYEVREI
jgi:TPR repeat protein